MSTQRDSVNIGGNAVGNVIVGDQNTVGDVRVGPAHDTGRHAAPEEVPAAPAGLTPRTGFVVDVVGYGNRTGPAKEGVQRRLRTLLGHTVADLDVDLDSTDHDDGAGDGMHVFLPVDTDPTRALPSLLRSTADRLAQDNDRYRDRIRLRMAVGSGLVGRGPLGFTGPLVVDLSRLNDSPSSRQAVELHPASDLVVLVSNALHDDVVRSGYLPPHVAEFQCVEVAVKEFSGSAWLWVSEPRAGGTGC